LLQNQLDAVGDGRLRPVPQPGKLHETYMLSLILAYFSIHDAIHETGST